MTGKNIEEHSDDDELGVLDDAGSVDTTGIGVLGGTAQVTVTLPSSDDDDLDDDGVVDDEQVFLDELNDDQPDSDEDASGDLEALDAEESDGSEADAFSAVDDADDATDADADIDDAVLDDAEPESGQRSADVDTDGFDEGDIDQVGRDAAGLDDAEADAAPRGAAIEAVPVLSDVSLTSKRIGDLSEAERESADLLTADRLLDPHHRSKPEPEGAWSSLLYSLSGKRINLGDGKKARARKMLTARIAAPLPGGARFVPVLSRKGGVGKTTITALLGMALADAREDRVVAIDANPDRGTLSDRVTRGNGKSVRDLVRIHDQVRGYQDISAMVSRDATRLDVIASDTDPHVAEAFSDSDYRDVADVAAHFYSVVLTDTGTGIVHSVMRETLEQSHQLVIVTGLSIDEARLASETLTWLESNGYAERAREAIVVLNKATPGASLVREDELETHFASRVRQVVRVPYDKHIASGSTITFADLQPETRQAARELAAHVIESLRSRADG